ncbi:hypothetical protein BH20ACT9_BH20ACT9_09540 [soil metagenome]
MLIGLLWAVVAKATGGLPTTAVGAAAVLVADAAVTGARPLGGLARVAEGVASRRPARGAVAVMREPYLGPAGVVALVLACLLRFSLLAGLVVAAAFARWWRGRFGGASGAAVGAGGLLAETMTLAVVAS